MYTETDLFNDTEESMSDRKQDGCINARIRRLWILEDMLAEPLGIEDRIPHARGRLRRLARFGLC